MAASSRKRSSPRRAESDGTSPTRKSVSAAELDKTLGKTSGGKEAEVPDDSFLWGNGFVVERLADKPLQMPLSLLLDKLREFGRIYLLRQIDWGSHSLLPTIISYRRPWLDYLAMGGTVAGGEEFFMLMVPLILWNWSARMAGLLLALMVLSVTGGNFFKNFMRLPRPPARFLHPTVSKLDNKGYGWPSTHAATSVALPFFCLRYTHFGAEDPVLHTALYVLASVWMLWISFSRMYLGVHSPGDVQGGMMLGGVTLHLMLNYADSFVDWVLHGTNVPVMATVAALALMMLHPLPYNSTFVDSASCIGALYGYVVSTWVHSQYLGMSTESPCIPMPAVRVACSLVGLVALFSIEHFFKKACRSVFHPLLGSQVGECVAKFWTFTAYCSVLSLLPLVFDAVCNTL